MRATLNQWFQRNPVDALMVIVMTVIFFVSILGSILIALAQRGREEPLPYVFSGEAHQVYVPVEPIICVGEPVQFPLQFTVNPPAGQWVRIEWTRTWHRVDQFGLVGSEQPQIWDYDRFAEFDFGIISATPPDGVGEGIWRLVGHGTVNGNQNSGGYTVTIIYVPCDDNGATPR